MKTMNKGKKKILFIHNTAMWYRRPFFKKLSELYDVRLVFTHILVSKDLYGIELTNEIEGLEGVNYRVIKNHFGIAFGVIKEAMEDFDVLIGGSWDSAPELIETIFYFMIAKLRRKPFILWSEEWDWKVKSLKRKLISSIINFILQNSDAILVPGTRHKGHFISLGVSPDRVFIMPNANNIIVKGEDQVTKEKLKEDLGLGDEKVVLYVGRLVKRKGVEYLIKAFARLRKERGNIILIITGRGECRDELELLVENLNVEKSVYLKGFIEDELLPAYFLLCDVCVVPSITYGMGDPWVFVVNEAMRLGKPVIATDAVGAAYDLIQNGINGFMVPERDVDALYGSMKKILSDPELEKKMGEESKQIVETGFSYKNMIDGFTTAVNFIFKHGN